MDSFTIGYVCFQFVIGLLVFGVLWWKKGWYTHTNTAASILTIIGVFGTFIGIFIGLQVFEIENLESSIPGLLNGLKLAFLTSLVGILEAIILKGYAFVYQMIRARDPSQEAINKFVDGLKEALESVETSGESNLSSKLDDLTKVIKDKDDIGTVLSGIRDVKTALTGETERTIFTQLQNLLKVVSESRLSTIETSLSDSEGNLLTELRSLKTEITTKHDELKSEFQAFSENVAESVAKLATDELIEALKTVIEDFNAKLTVQFGENFKQLNEAVGRTVAWQEQYRQQMDKLADEFRVAAESIEQSRVSMEQIAEASSEIADKSSSIVVCAEDMEPLLHTLNDQLEAFSNLRDQAHEAFPLIENRLNNLTTRLSAAVEQTIDSSHVSMETQRRKLNEHADELEDTVSKIALELKNLVERNKEDIENHVNILHGDLRKEVNTLNESLRAELTNSLQTLAGNIESLSNGFVDNYQELAGHYAQALTALTQFVNASQQAQSKRI
ncbi:hypothetical protein C6501_01665 [Candidatus Poribacteria bacterium]|nr:MAG: hypothetical protein C6501_01665 [Candidatus Poribacteria bacterium]